MNITHSSVRRSHRLGIAAVSVAGAFLLGGCGDSAATSPPVKPSTVRQATPVAAPTPDTGMTDYTALVHRDAPDMGTKSGAVAAACGDATNLAPCRSAVVAVRDSAQTFLDDLGVHPVPSVLAQADGTIRQAVADYVSGSNLILKGLDDTNGDEISTGAGQFQVGTDLLNKGTGQIKTAVGQG